MLGAKIGSDRTLRETVQDVQGDIRRRQENLRDALRDAGRDFAQVARTGGRERYKGDVGFWPGFISGCLVGGVFVAIISFVANRDMGVMGYRMPVSGLREEVKRGTVPQPHGDRQRRDLELEEKAEDIRGRETAMNANEPRQTVPGILAAETEARTP
jgi:hypothetical protein